MAVAMVGAPSILRSQTASGVLPHIAVLLSGIQATFDPHSLESFRKGLAENGLVDGRNVTVSYDSAEANDQRLRELSGRLAQGDAAVVASLDGQSARPHYPAGNPRARRRGD
jgi:hypothetical protein